MANRCPSCGGTLRFDIKKQKLVCEYCESEFDAESIAQMGGAEESPAYDQSTANEATDGETIDAKIFTCPNCGAEVFATDLDAVEYCSYCGTFVTLESRLAKLQKPSYIVPFTITKEKCLELYKNKLKKARFLPKDMTAENAESNFHNFYIPFWVYEMDFDKNSPIEAFSSESWTRGNKEYTQHYGIQASADGQLGNIFYDASATLDDRISEQIGNFSTDSLQDYNSSLMAGAYADVADVQKGIYEETVYETGKDFILDAMRTSLIEQCKDSKNSPVRKARSLAKFSSAQDERNYSKVTAKLAMLPVWFMTWKNKNRLCYAVVNGNTGKMFTEIPSDLKKYTIASFILSIPIFIFLEFFFTLMPKTLLTVTLTLLLLIILCYWKASSKLKRQENRTDDRGFQKVLAKKQKKADTKASSGFNTLLNLVAIGLSALLIVLDLPNDLYYYGAAFLCIAAIFAMIASLVKAYNLSCSRPIPHFYDKRKGA